MYPIYFSVSCTKLTKKTINIIRAKKKIRSINFLLFIFLIIDSIEKYLHYAIYFVENIKFYF